MEKEFFAKGKRSVVYKSKLNGILVAIKEERKDINAIERVNNEVRWLKRLNKHGIGPKLIKSGNNYFIYKFIEGERILDYIEGHNWRAIREALIEVLRQCRVMDKLLVSKEEMHRPVKHILVGKEVKMIDFERCHSTERPKNVTQFCQFIMSKKLNDLLMGKKKIGKERLLEAVKQYKDNYSEDSFRKIIGSI